ncbi:MAG: hypothetical protein CL876_02645 [Dehalococcoidales bacterium]|nr:hypothetical protein [Dehalococcoidales bacterium]
MGKNPDPSWEELELIFKGFSENQDEQTIREEIQESMSVPKSKRFICQRKLHFDVARKVLQVAITREIDPVIIEQRKHHFAQLADITKNLLENGVDTIKIACHDLIESEYQIAQKDGALSEIDKEGISNELERNLYNLCLDQGSWDFENLFLPHFSEEYTGLKGKYWEQVLEENPYEIAASLRILARRATFGGICPICKDW